MSQEILSIRIVYIIPVHTIFCYWRKAEYRSPNYAVYLWDTDLSCKSLWLSVVYLMYNTGVKRFVSVCTAPRVLVRSGSVNLYFVINNISHFLIQWHIRIISIVSANEANSSDLFCLILKCRPFFLTLLAFFGDGITIFYDKTSL